jgi:hypothetical protein
MDRTAESSIKPEVEEAPANGSSCTGNINPVSNGETNEDASKTTGNSKNRNAVDESIPTIIVTQYLNAASTRAEYFPNN